MKLWNKFKQLTRKILFKVKTIITLVVVFNFTFKVITGADINSEFFTIFAVVTTYWLCDKSGKDE